MTYVYDWRNVCLVCLQKGENRCIFEKEDECDLSIAEKIMKCSDFQISKNSEQPNNICMLCLGDLNTAYKFRLNCEQSNSIIKAILGKENRELEVSGLRIKIPSGLKVKKVLPDSLERGEVVDENSLDEGLIKHEEDDCKAFEDCDNFDSGDYLVGGEVVEEDEDREQTENIPGVLEDIEKLDLFPIQEIRPVRTNRVMKTKESQQKKGRRRKNVFTRTTDPDITGETFEKGYAKKSKPAVENKPQKICEVCGNSYKYQHALNSHMRRHRNERPFNCEFCEKAFVSAVELRRHMRVHTGQKPYECQYCCRRFSDYGSRIKHERTHTGERPYVCSTCGKSFAYAHVLTVHMRTHTGEKKYTCRECGRGFTKKTYLDNHMTHHATNAISDDIYETTEATATIVKEYEDKTYIDQCILLSENDMNHGIKPKEEHFDEVMMQDEFQTMHVP